MPLTRLYIFEFASSFLGRISLLTKLKCLLPDRCFRPGSIANRHPVQLADQVSKKVFVEHGHSK